MKRLSGDVNSAEAGKGLVAVSPFQILQRRVWCQTRDPPARRPLSPAWTGPPDQEPFPQQKSLFLALAGECFGSSPRPFEASQPHPKWLPKDLDHSLKLAVPIMVPIAPCWAPDDRAPAKQTNLLAPRCPSPEDGDLGLTPDRYQNIQQYSHSN